MKNTKGFDQAIYGGLEFRDIPGYEKYTFVPESVMSLLKAKTPFSKDLINTFREAENLEVVDINDLDTSEVKYFEGMFAGCHNLLTVKQVHAWGVV